MEHRVRALIYSRVSTDSQERDGTSLDTQERACLEYAESKGWCVVECIRDTASGYTLERPGIGRVRQLLRSRDAEMIVAYAVDRISRNQNHIGVLFDDVEQAGARLEFITEKFEDTATGRFILAARAFIAEVEREKISERTMRGKAERARSGRIPQGTGMGCYGYIYDPKTGRRQIDSYQGTIVRRIFQRYAETRSFSAVSNELNKEGIRTFSSSRWYPSTIRRVLKNESYTGRFVYRRTKRIRVLDGNARRLRSQVVPQPEEMWIKVDGGSPRIIEEAQWQRVQDILNDPERTLTQPSTRSYLLRGRAECGVCGSAMVGQTLTVKERPYRYYRCRHAYTTSTGHSCTARYVRGDNLEGVVWREVTRVLTNPSTVLQELEKQMEAEVDGNQVAQWGRMAIVDTKPFKLRVILHRIFVERPQVTGIPAWPGGAACYRRSRYIL